MVGVAYFSCLIYIVPWMITILEVLLHCKRGRGDDCGDDCGADKLFAEAPSGHFARKTVRTAREENQQIYVIKRYFLYIFSPTQRE